jgi:peptidoglycan hydrolase CwlO-like protein
MALPTLTPEQRKAALEKAKENRADRRDKLTDEQKAWAKAYGEEVKSTHGAVKAGTLTRQTAAEQLKAWRDANPRPKSSHS